MAKTDAKVMKEYRRSLARDARIRAAANSEIRRENGGGVVSQTCFDWNRLKVTVTSPSAAALSTPIGLKKAEGHSHPTGLSERIEFVRPAKGDLLQARPKLVLKTDAVCGIACRLGLAGRKV